MTHKFNSYYTNKIIIKDLITLEKIKENKKLIEGIADITTEINVS